jgi:hypothetical protein
VNNFQNIPTVLRGRTQWLNWESVPNSDPQKKPMKKPLVPKVPKGEKTYLERPEWWKTFEEAVQMVTAGDAHGIGFVLTKEDPYFCVDLDHCFDDGPHTPQAVEIAASLNTWGETSVSGKGIHFWGQGKKPQGAGCRNAKAEVEIYTEARWIAMTGDPLEGYEDLPLRDCQEELTALCHKFFPGASAALPKSSVKPTESWSSTPLGNADDRTVLERLERMKPEVYKRTHSPGNSEDDFSVITALNWLTGNDFAQVERVMRSTGMSRPKWDETRGTASFLLYEIKRGVSAEAYDPAYYKAQIAQGLAAKGADMAMPVKEAVETTFGGNKVAQMTREDVLAVAAIEDDFEREQAREHLRQRVRLSEKVYQKLEAIAQNQAKPDEPETETGTELYASTVEEANEWLLPGIIPATGFVTLSAKQKEGKSQWCYALARSVLLGNAFLGLPVAKKTVMIIQCDEARGMFRGEVKRWRLPVEVRGALLLRYKFDLSPAGLKKLEADLARHSPSLVIIDSLSAINQGSGRSQNDTDIGEALYPLGALLDKHKAAGILIHHVRKPPAKEKARKNIRETSETRGSTAITAASSGNLVMTKNLAGKYFLNVENRRGPSGFYSFIATPDDNGGLQWDDLKEINSDEKEIDTTLDKRILALLENNPRGLTSGKITDLLELEGKYHLNVLKKLVSTGRLKKAEGVYTLGNSANTVKTQSVVSDCVTNTVNPILEGTFGKVTYPVTCESHAGHTRSHVTDCEKSHTRSHTIQIEQDVTDYVTDRKAPVDKDSDSKVTHTVTCDLHGQSSGSEPKPAFLDFAPTVFDEKESEPATLPSPKKPMTHIEKSVASYKGTDEYNDF